MAQHPKTSTIWTMQMGASRTASFEHGIELRKLYGGYRLTVGEQVPPINSCPGRAWSLRSPKEFCCAYPDRLKARGL